MQIKIFPTKKNPRRPCRYFPQGDPNEQHYSHAPPFKPGLFWLSVVVDCFITSTIQYHPVPIRSHVCGGRNNSILFPQLPGRRREFPP